MAPIQIHTLPSIYAAANESALRDEIEQGLIGTRSPVVPGNEAGDKQWSYTRSVPTMCLYDEAGLRLYDKITSEALEYYLFNDELNLLKTHGADIARSMGFPGREREQKEKEKDEEVETEAEGAPAKPWRQARWGDMEVGKWNGGVNGEAGLGGGWERGYDIVELGAGALRKTAHLLTALSEALPSAPDNHASLPAPIIYHPLDLSHPELHRTLGQMHESFGDKFDGRVACVGLHGDYNAGLDFIREGKLESIRPQVEAAPASAGLQLEMESAPAAKRDISVTPSSRSYSTSTSAPQFTPGPHESPLPSTIADEESVSGAESASGTWSPVENESLGLSRHSLDTTKRPLHLVFLGSSIGNFPREAAAPFLQTLPLSPGDTLLIGLDGRPRPGKEGCTKVELAYNDPSGYTRAFEEHGWDVVRQELGLNGDAGVEFVGRYNETLGRHEAYYRVKGDETLSLPSGSEVTLKKDELLNIEWSYKYSEVEALDLFHRSNLRVVNSWKAPDSEYRLWLLERPELSFATMSTAAADEKTKTKAVPEWAEWVELWKMWDHITLEMIPEEMLHQKPIDLRHICLFYLGHIPTFLDIFLTRLTNGAHTEPEFYKDIFERGIDPDVDDPTKIHPHSEVPSNETDWPSLTEILGFRDRVRARLRSIYDALESGEMEFTRRVARVIWMTYEHEAMHAETLLYMLIQSPLTRPPTIVATPNFDILSKRWREEKQENRILVVPAGEITLGHHDLEAEDAQPFDKDDYEFGWDDEHSSMEPTKVASFRIDSLPISNDDYAAFLKAKTTQGTTIPASWIDVEGEWKIRSLYGPVSFEAAGAWPLMASKNEIDEFVASKGGRLATEAELRLFWASEQGPRVVGPDANVGLKNWHPIPPTNTKTANDGRILHGHNGGIWEWTDTELSGLKGYVPSELYPGYSSDFFDGKHYTVLGGSYASIPRIAARDSFRNFYQANYRFSFVGARVAYDL
ncbi:L-histidine Nalpha-methyltransferase / hercynylcysteine S-oxide synthase, partial [Tremellales sp. Uapishka_1]